VAAQPSARAQPYKTPAILPDIQYIVIHQSIFYAISADIDLLRQGQRTITNLEKKRQYGQEEFQHGPAYLVIWMIRNLENNDHIN
ncbi:MAG TPA: hypothetical protein VK622_17175, partial [Puia sp.]|nr:hypothetical protein [Puia sp.]